MGEKPTVVAQDCVCVAIRRH